MAEDSASNLAQFDTVYARFIKILDTAEELDDMHVTIACFFCCVVFCC